MRMFVADRKNNSAASMLSHVRVLIAAENAGCAVRAAEGLGRIARDLPVPVTFEQSICELTGLDAAAGSHAGNPDLVLVVAETPDAIPASFLDWLRIWLAHRQAPVALGLMLASEEAASADAGERFERLQMMAWEGNAEVWLGFSALPLLDRSRLVRFIAEGLLPQPQATELERARPKRESKRGAFWGLGEAIRGAEPRRTLVVGWLQALRRFGRSGDAAAPGAR